MNRISWIVRKDLLRFIADRNGALMTLLMPVVLGMLMGVLFAPRETAESVALLVAAAEDAPAVVQLVAALDASDTLDVERVSATVARERVAAGEASVALVLPEGTARSLSISALFAGGRQEVRLLYDPSKEVEARMAAGLITQIMMREVTRGFTRPETLARFFEDLERSLADEEVSPEWRRFIAYGKRVAGHALDDGSKTAPLEEEEEEGGMRPPVEIVREAVVAAGPTAGYDSYAHNFAGMLVFFLLFWGQRSAVSLHRERAEGTLMRVRLTGTSRRQILLGTGASTAAVALAVSVIVFAIAVAVFGVRIHGSWFGLAAVLLTHAVFVGGFTLLLAGVAHSEAQIENIATLVILLMAFLGGAWIPAFLLPDWLQQGTLVIPTRWATQGLAAMTWRGLPLSAALIPSAVLLLMAGVCGAIGIRRFRWD